MLINNMLNAWILHKSNIILNIYHLISNNSETQSRSYVSRVKKIFTNGTKLIELWKIMAFMEEHSFLQNIMQGNFGWNCVP